MSEPTRLERIGLGLVFCGPPRSWLAMARFLRIRVTPASVLDDSVFHHADTEARTATRRFVGTLIVAGLTLVAFGLLLSTQHTFMAPFIDRGMGILAMGLVDAGIALRPAVIAANVGMTLLIFLEGALSAVLLCTPAVLLIRGCARAAAPAVSIALAYEAEPSLPRQVNDYPRLDYAIRRVLDPRGAGI